MRAKHRALKPEILNVLVRGLEVLLVLVGVAVPCLGGMVVLAQVGPAGLLVEVVLVGEH